MPVKYLCDICEAEATNSTSKIVTTTMNEHDRLLVLDFKLTWQHKDYTEDPNVLAYPAYICNQCIKEAITKEM